MMFHKKMFHYTLQHDTNIIWALDGKKQLSAVL